MTDALTGRNFWMKKSNFLMQTTCLIDFIL